MPDSARFTDLWSLLHEGGLVIETRAADTETAPLALRTIVQLDGGRITKVVLPAVAPLAPQDRLDLTARHSAAVQARSVGILADGQKVLPLLRYGVAAILGGTEVHSLASRLSFSGLWQQTDWHGLLRDQVPCLILLIVRLVLPRAVRTLLPYVLRWRHAGTARRLADDRHEDTRQLFFAGHWQRK